MNNAPFSVSCNNSAPSIKKLPKICTIKETAQLFGLAEHFIRQLVLSGEIVAVRAGTKCLVNIDRLTDYLNTTKITAHTGAEDDSVSGITPIPVNFR